MKCVVDGTKVLGVLADEASGADIFEPDRTSFASFTVAV